MRSHIGVSESSVFRRGICWLLLGLGCLLAGASGAQVERYELGARVRACEAAWDAYPTSVARGRAVPRMQGAVMSFFSGQFAAVGKSLDEARFALLSEKPPTPELVWASSLFCQPDCRFVDTSEKQLAYTLAPFYKLGTSIPKSATLELLLSDRNSKVGSALRSKFNWKSSLPITSLPLKGEIPLNGVPEGDLTLQVRILVAGQPLQTEEMTLSFSAHLNTRLEKLQAFNTKQATEAKPDANSLGDTSRQTLAGLTKLLAALAGKQTFETDYPASRLLQEAEGVVEAIGAGKNYYGQKRVGQFWMTLVNGKSAIASRLLAPKAVETGKPLPLVIALHGAGGSENLFFDGYGRGKIVGMCEQRGWLLVAPRAPGGFGAVYLPDVIEAVAKLYPVDRKRVFVVGHSMGAMQGISAVQRSPEIFAAFAALSGGGPVTPSESLKKLPFFLGAGTQDFGLGMVQQAQSALKKAEVSDVVFREYPECEHLFAVQVALPDVFAFFDKIAASVVLK